MSAAWREAFAGKSVFITGHTGFKGSWLSIWLHRLGARVTGYSLKPPTEPNNFTLSRVRELLAEHHEGDVRDGLRLQRALARAKPKFVFHLAAQPIVRLGYEQPRGTFETNVIGTVSLLEAVRHSTHHCVVLVVTSDKCYASPPEGATELELHPLGFRETDPVGGHDPYSASKGCTELVVSTYRESYFPPSRMNKHQVWLASVRAGNVIGGGDWGVGRIIPDVVKSIAAAKAVPVRSPQALRPWQHVLEPLRGYLMLAACLRNNILLPDYGSRHTGAWNFGPLPDSEAYVRDLVEKFISAYGRGTWQDASPYCSTWREVSALRLSSEKAIRLLGWRPRWGLEEAVRRTAQWYRRYYVDGETDMRPACLDDIAAYEAAEQANPP